MKALAVIPRAGLTEFAVYEDGAQILSETLRHSQEDLRALADCAQEGRFRSERILEIVERRGDILEKIDIAVSATGALLPPEPGTYLVTGEMLGSLSALKQVEGMRKLGAYVVWSVSEALGRKYEIECLPVVTEPTAVSDMIPEALLSGIREVERHPVYHALSQRGAARSYAVTAGKKTDELNLIVAHLGAEISVGAHQMGRVVDCNSPLDGEGPFSPRTSGTLPTDALFHLCYSGKYDMDELLRMVEREGGLTAHLGTGRLVDAQEAYADGDPHVRFLVRAMAYKVAREIGARTAALCGKVDAILFTGSWASFEEFTDEIRSYVEWIAPVHVYSWESELRSLGDLAAQVLDGTEKLRLYSESA